MTMFEKYAVSPCQLFNPDTYCQFRNRTSLITICNYGGGRSPEACWRLDKLGVDAIFLSCGLTGLKDLSEDYCRVVFERINGFSQRIVFLQNLEIPSNRRLLEAINVKESDVFNNTQDYLRHYQSIGSSLLNIR